MGCVNGEFWNRIFGPMSLISNLIKTETCFFAFFFEHLSLKIHNLTFKSF